MDRGMGTEEWGQRNGDRGMGTEEWGQRNVGQMNNREIK